MINYVVVLVVKVILDFLSSFYHFEDEFIKLAFDLGDVEGLSAEEVRSYIRYIANRRLIQLDLKPMYNINNNPLPWLDEILNGVEHTNFFENRVTEYSRAATQGTWEEAFS